MRTGVLVWLVLLVVGAVPSRADAQRHEVAATVVQIAGTDFYLNVGEQDGVTANDTVALIGLDDRALTARLVVLSSSRSRSVVAFVGDPTPVTRGARLRLLVDPPPLAPEPVTRRPMAVSRSQNRSRVQPRLDGRFSVEVQTLNTTTVGFGANPDVRERQFTTPAARLHAAVTALPGGLELHASARGESRYVGDLGPSETLVRVYQASLQRRATGVPLQFQLGRFASAYESFSGYWDGLLVRVGNRSVGVGVAAGFEPDRVNQGFSGERLKYSAFVNVGAGGRAASYTTDLSVHRVQAGAGLPERSFAGWAQRLRVGGLRLGSRVEVDRRSSTGRVWLTQARVDATQRLGGAVSLRARYTVRDPSAYWPDSIQATVRYQQGGLGLAVSGQAGYAALDVAVNRPSSGTLGWTYTTTMLLTRLPVWRLQVDGSASYWTLDVQSGVSASVGVGRVFGRARTRVGYRYYRSAVNATRFTSHAVDLLLDLPLTRRIRSSFRARVEDSEHLRNVALYSGLSVGF